MINSLILKSSISLGVNIVIYHPDINFTGSYFLPKYLNVNFHDLRGSSSLAIVITSYKDFMQESCSIPNYFFSRDACSIGNYRLLFIA